MSVAILLSRAQIGTAAPPVTIEVFLSGGLPAFSIVGMAETAVRESKDRVRSALLSSGFRFPQERITVSLGPADMRKTGGRFDLAVALGILAASRQINAAAMENYEFFGELALNGELRPVPGMLPAALRATEDGRRIVVPSANAAEAALVSTGVYPATSLLEVTSHLVAEMPIDARNRTRPEINGHSGPDIAEVRGQPGAKRALEVAAAGGHNLLMVGPPGTGKSMLASRLPSLMPPMTEQEAIETAAIDSVLGNEPDLAHWRSRPFRSPHHTATAASLVGGGSDPRPGEISRAHNGVLFLDELPEFSRSVLEVLREPLEAGRITISRASAQTDFPARFQLVAAMNPCPCGYLGDLAGDCNCSAERVAGYRARISGPLLDRIDLRVVVGRPPRELLRGPVEACETSGDVRQRVTAARERQLERQGLSNSRLSGSDLDEHCELDSNGWALLDRAADKFAFSVRSYQRVLKVSRTIADLTGAKRITPPQIAEALGLRGCAVK